jgi:phosphatidylinositol glycan class M
VLTDIDHKVYSDAAKKIVHGDSPYDRHTYRYTPLLAQLLAINKYRFSLGKYLFVLFDGLCLLLITAIFRNSIVPLLLYGLNPILIYITARGSCESISCFLMFLVMLLDLKNLVILAGVIYGL